MAKFKKGYINPYHHSLMSNNPSEMFDYTMTNLMDEFYNTAMSNATDGSFKAVCLSAISTGDNTGGGTGASDGIANNGFVDIVVRPLTNFGDILPDPRLFSDVEKINQVISMHASSFTARSDYAIDASNPVDFAQIVDCYFEKGSIEDSNFAGLRFSNPSSKMIEVSYQQLALVGGFRALSSYYSGGGTFLLGSVPTMPTATAGNYTTTTTSSDGIPAPTPIPGATNTIAMIGDSHAEVVFRSLQPLLEKKGFVFTFVYAKHGWSLKKHIEKGNLDRLKQARPKTILLSLGGNNQSLKEQDYKKTVDKIIDLAKSIGAKIIWVGPTTSDSQKAASTERRHAWTEQFLSKYISQHGQYISVRDITKTGQGKDGVHYPISFYANKWAPFVSNQITL